MTTNDLKDLPHIVVLRTNSDCQCFDYSGPGCMERAHMFAVKLSSERPEACVTVAHRYRQIYSAEAMHLAAN